MGIDNYENIQEEERGESDPAELMGWDRMGLVDDDDDGMN